MTMISIQSGARRRQPSSIEKALITLQAEAAKRRRIRKAMKELSQLHHHHLLRNMGLEQYAAPNVPTIPNHRL